MSVNKKCFVIFPFKKPYESRYEKIYKSALQAAGLKVVRAGGPGVGIITKDIEKKIKESFICFADLTEENANVWYEVGYAYACDKKVVMVCNTDERPLDKLPFDIRGRNIIGYSKAILKNKKTRLSFMAEVTEDAEAKMAKAQKATLAKKDAPITPQISTPSKNPLVKIVYENLTKNDMDVLKEIVNYHIRHRDWGISEAELLEKIKHPPLLPSAISKLLGGRYIDQRYDFRYRTESMNKADGFNKDRLFSTFPTDKAMKLSRENYNLFLDEAN